MYLHNCAHYLHDLSGCHACTCHVACIHMTTHSCIYMTPTIFHQIVNFTVFVLMVGVSNVSNTLIYVPDFLVILVGIKSI